MNPPPKDLFDRLNIFRSELENITDDKETIRSLTKRMTFAVLESWKDLKFQDTTHNAGYMNGMTYNDYVEKYTDINSIFFRMEDRFIEFVNTVIKQRKGKENRPFMDDGWNSLITLFGNQFASYQCSCCGREYLWMGDYEAGIIRCAGAGECPYPNGIKDPQVTVNFSSGKIVFANIFKDVYDTDYSDFTTYGRTKYGIFPSLNYANGTVIQQEFQAERNVAYFACGNSDPSVFKDSVTGVIEIKRDSLATPNDVYQGYVCTSLWAVQGVDYDTLKNAFDEFMKEDDDEVVDVDKQQIAFNEYLKSIDAFIVYVEPGIYTSTAIFETPYLIDDEPSIWGRLELKEKL